METVGALVSPLYLHDVHISERGTYGNRGETAIAALAPVFGALRLKGDSSCCRLLPLRQSS
jgi:hypothetical protein